MFLLLVWAALTAGALGFVIAFGSNAPYADEWEFVPVLVGAEPVGPWLWAQHNEHRLPLPRAVYYVLFQLTRDFRTGMLVQVGLLSALSLGLMRVAARLRGRPAWADAFFPISLLHLGHWENWIMGYQLCFALFAVLAAGLVVVALRATRGTALRSGLAAGGLTLLLVLTGGPGLAVAPPVCAWVAYLAAVVWRAGGRGAVVLLLLAAAPVAYAGLYLAGYERPPLHPPPGRDVPAAAETAGVILGLGFGVGLSGVWWAVAAGELALGAATVALLVRRGAGEAPSSAGLLAVAAGLFGMVLAVGAARAEWGAEAVKGWSRYALLVWPLPAAAYLVWVRAGRTWVPAGLCVAAALAFPANTGTGMAVGHRVRGQYDRMAADARAGLPAEELVRRHFPGGPNEGQVGRGVEGVSRLREAGIGVFAGN